MSSAYSAASWGGSADSLLCQHLAISLRWCTQAFIMHLLRS